MTKRIRYIIFSLHIVLSVLSASSQEPTTPGELDSLINSTIVDTIGKQLPDSVFQVKDNHRSNNDSLKDTLPKIIVAWQYDIMEMEKISVEVDTMLENFTVVNPLYKKSFSNVYLGNLGMAGISNIFMDREYDSRFFFLKPFETYGFFPETNKYYNTRRRYTNLTYTNGDKKSFKEQIINVKHSQNITEKLNAGLEYQLLHSLGEYRSQKTKVTGLLLYSSYLGEFYSMHFCGTRNKYAIFENGGLTNTTYFESDSLQKDELPMRLGNYNEVTQARTEIKDRNLFLTNEVRVVRRKVAQNVDSTETITEKHYLTIGHTFRYEDSYKLYKDFNPLSGFYASMYVDTLDSRYDTLHSSYLETQTPIFVDSTSTYDSVFSRIIDNRVYVTIPEHWSGKLKLSVRIIYGNEIIKQSFLQITNDENESLSVFSNYRKDTILKSNYLRFRLFRESVGKWNINFSPYYYFNGYRTDDYGFHWNFLRHVHVISDSLDVTFSGSFNQQTPDFYEENYYSNHFKWDSVFKKKDITKFNLIVEKPNWHLRAGVQYALLDNYIYFDQTAYPRQQTHTFDVMTLFVDKTFVLGDFYLMNKVVYQKSGNDDALRIPMFVLYHSTYYKKELHFKRTKGRLLILTGLSLQYYSSYRASAWKPITATYYNQDYGEIGNYPYIDLFFSMKLKRSRFFLSGTHLNAFLKNNEYYHAYNHPAPGFAFKMGLSWSFYD